MPDKHPPIEQHPDYERFRDIWNGALEKCEGYCRDAQAHADRLTTAAQAARDALEPFDREAQRMYAVETVGEVGNSVELWQSGAEVFRRTRITYGDLRRAREALASLASALDQDRGSNG